MKTIQTILFVIAAIIVIDFFGMIMWASSGQKPLDNAYIGTISTHAIRAVIGENQKCSLPDPQFSGAEMKDYAGCE
jgi:hypothetical protein